MKGHRVCVSDFEEEAKKVLPKSVYDYYRSGADGQSTLADNVAAFDRYNTQGCIISIEVCFFVEAQTLTKP